MKSNALHEGPIDCSDDERTLLDNAAKWPEFRSWSDLTQPVLAQLAAELGMDFATALLYERLRRSEKHGPLIRRVDELVTRPRTTRGRSTSCWRWLRVRSTRSSKGRVAMAAC